MKKLLGSLIVSLFFVSASGVLNVPSSFARSPLDPAPLHLLNSVNFWLSSNNQSRINRINDLLEKGLEQAKLWRPHARLQEFSLDYSLKNEAMSCVFLYSDANTPGKVFQVICPLGTQAISGVETVSTTKNNGIYRVPLRLRDLVPALRDDITFHDLIEEKLLGDPNNADVSVNFHLKKNVTGDTIWEATFVDHTSGKKMIVRAKANDTTPTFSFFNGK